MLGPEPPVPCEPNGGPVEVEVDGCPVEVDGCPVEVELDDGPVEVALDDAADEPDDVTVTSATSGCCSELASCCAVPVKLTVSLGAVASGGAAAEYVTVTIPPTSRRIRAIVIVVPLVLTSGETGPFDITKVNPDVPVEPASVGAGQLSGTCTVRVPPWNGTKAVIVSTNCAGVPAATDGGVIPSVA
ncbi:MAG: hypothetical protein ACLQFR_08660 [Streptosporangiaceae bacterium]